jgi:hypothetical protein
VESPFPTSLRRSPGNPQRLLDRIDAQLLERIEEACDFFCLDLLVQRRTLRGQPVPTANNQADRQEFSQLVEEFLSFLREGFGARLSKEDAASLRAVEARLTGTKPQRLLAVQAHLAKTLPDFWERFDEFSGAFSRQRLAEAPPKPGFFSRLLGS